MSAGLAIAFTSQSFKRVLADQTGRFRWNRLSDDAVFRLSFSLLAAATIVTAIVVSSSRSGVGALVIVLASILLLQSRRPGELRQRSIVYPACSVLAVLLIIVVVLESDSQIWNRVGALPADLALRVDAWRDALRVIKVFPWFGTGLNTYGTAMLFYQRTRLEFHFAAAHSDLLQLVAEGGVLVAVPAAVAAMVFVKRAMTLLDAEVGLYDRWIRIGALSGLVGMACQELVEFSLQIPANGFFAAMLCGIALAPTPKR